MGSGADKKNLDKLDEHLYYIFVINGYPLSGKDSFAKNLSLCLKEKYWQCNDYSSVDEIKEAATLLGWDGVKDEKNRLFLSKLKDMGTIYFNSPLKYMQRMVVEFKEKYSKGVIIFHIREPEEIFKFKEIYPETKTIFMKRNNKQEVYGNHADQNVENYTYDITIHNNEGLQELRDKARLFSTQLATGELLQSEY